MGLAGRASPVPVTSLHSAVFLSFYPVRLYGFLLLRAVIWLILDAFAVLLAYFHSQRIQGYGWMNEQVAVSAQVPP